MCTGTHKHVCRHTYKHTHMCTVAHINTQKRVCAALRAHVRNAHTNTCTCVCAHQPWGRASPSLWKAPTTWAGPLTPAASAFLLQDLLLVAATCLCVPCVCVCVCAPQEERVCVCVPTGGEVRPQTTGEGGTISCAGFASSPQARLQAHGSRWARKT